MDDGPKYFTPAGDQFGSNCKYVVRYSLLKEVKEEFQELAPGIQGDVF